MIPLFIPHTPGEELVKRIRKKEAENNQGRTIRFLVVGKGGVTLENTLRRSNPWAGGKCGRDDCFPCMGDKGGDCRREGVNYSLWCEECGSGGASYKGETGRNSYTRGLEHRRSILPRNEDKSVLWSHSVHHHQGRTDICYRMMYRRWGKG